MEDTMSEYMSWSYHPGMPKYPTLFQLTSEAGTLIAASRMAAGLTRKQLADHLGVRERVIEWIELGKMGFGTFKRSKILRARLEQMVKMYPPKYTAIEGF